MSARVAILPSDRLERARLWREWVRNDAPAGQLAEVRRATVGGEWTSEVIDAPPSVVNGLRRAIAESMTGDELTLGDRRRLLARCERLGLNRFEGNLLIAAVVHRMTGTQRVVRTVRPRAQRISTVTLVAGAVLFEILVAAVALFACLR